MIRLKVPALEGDRVGTMRERLQMAVALEFSTLPPYLYAMFSIEPGSNAAASSRLKDIVMQEMLHMSLACNILNAIGGDPNIIAAVPTYPGPLPGDIGSDPTTGPFLVHLLGFSEAAIQQGARIEEPEDPIPIPTEAKLTLADEQEPEFQTIGQFYHWLDRHLAALPADAWQPNRNQMIDDQFLVGDLFAVNSYLDAHRAIQRIVSEGEGSKTSPIDFQGDVAHFYRFEEIRRNATLTKDVSAQYGYVYDSDKPLGIDWRAAFPAIPDPGTHDFSGDPPAHAAQVACNRAFTRMVRSLQDAVGGTAGSLGQAVRHMFDLRQATLAALRTPLAGGPKVAGPAFLYLPALV